MQGLRTQESEKFNRFWTLVQEKAASLGCIFFAENGEGRDFETQTMEGEDFCGWLIPKKDAGGFEPAWLAGKVSDDWLEWLRWLKWKRSGDNISVEFKKY